MRHFCFFTIFYTLVFFSSIFASSPNYLEGDLAVGYSYRQDSFSAKTIDINTLESEINFDNILIHQVTARGTLLMGKFYFRGLADAGWVYGGSAGRKENVGDIEIFEHSADVNGCSVFDVSGGVGYLYECLDAGYKVAPLFGYSWSRQDFETKDVILHVDFINELPAGLCITGFRESYSLDWQGPWFGVDFVYDYYACWKLFGSAEFHWAVIHGKFKTSNATVNYFVFDQLKRDESGCGHGLVFNMGASFDLCMGWTLFTMANYQMWDLWNGCGKDEDDDLVKIKSLDWSSWHLTVGVACAF